MRAQQHCETHANMEEQSTHKEGAGSMQQENKRDPSPLQCDHAANSACPEEGHWQRASLCSKAIQSQVHAQTRNSPEQHNLTAYCQRPRTKVQQPQQIMSQTSQTSRSCPRHPRNSNQDISVRLAAQAAHGCKPGQSPAYTPCRPQSVCNALTCYRMLICCRHVRLPTRTVPSRKEAASLSNNKQHFEATQQPNG